MATHVYANGHEIACKATDGEAKVAFPDPCWSPPGPPAGPVVIPYPNTAFAKDITNGTQTVFIKGKEVAIEDKAYFSTSTGNEPATRAFGMGVITGVITGKAYFQTWSFDVIFEGLGVDRNVDMVSHNHASMPSNTALFPYVSRKTPFHDCRKEEQRIKEECQPEKDESDTRRKVRSKSRVSQLLRAQRGKGKSDKRDDKGWHWTDDHCDGLNIPLDSKKDAEAYMKRMEEIGKNIPSELEELAKLRPMLAEMALNAGKEAAAKWAAKAGAKQLLGSSVPAWGNAVMAIWSAVDAVNAIGDVAEIKKTAQNALEQLDVLKGKIKDMQNLSKRFEDFSKMSPEKKLEMAQEIATEGQDLLATLNPCTRARKCNLVPHTQNDRSKGVEPANKGGCCDGQTGRHLIPGASMEESCPGYKHETAPTVCVEGTSQHFGSHKRAHEKYAKSAEAVTKDANGRMTMQQTIDAAVESHQEAFPYARCSKECLKAQLEGYYNEKCKNAKPYPVDKNAMLIKPVDGGV